MAQPPPPGPITSFASVTFNVAQFEGMAEAACKKAEFLERSKLSYLISAALAGAYIGLGIILIFSIGSPLLADDSPLLKLLM